MKQPGFSSATLGCMFRGLDEIETTAKASIQSDGWLRQAAVAGVVLAGITVMFTGPARADADAKIERLLDLLVQKKIVSSRQAKELLRQTDAETAPLGSRRAAPRGAEPLQAKQNEIRVTYVPQFIRKQIADEVRAQVLTESQQEGWAAPGVIPDWTRRFTLYGDMRVRYDRDTFDRNNYNQFVNFAAINNGSPFDFSSYGGGANNVANPPFLNTTQDRDRPRIRARFGVQAAIDDGLTADFRISTGADNGPVTPNQTMGSPGDFAKYNAFIDRANFAYQPLADLKTYIGRENNPFFTTDLIFYSELGFDGAAVKYTPRLSNTLDAFLVGGAFPILNTAFDFSTNSSTKFGSTNAYLFALQGGFEWKVRPDITTKIGVGFFDFNGVQGAVSAPCSIQAGSQFYCSTDATRFPFQQFGNTVYAIRNIVTANQGTNPLQPEYFGLASRFAVLDVHPRVEITSYHPFDVLLEGEYLKNLAYNRAAILDHGPANFIGPQNNFGSTSNQAGTGPYQGGDTAYLLKAVVGNLAIHKRWDWNATVAYKYLETDSTLDSINDADFHLGGTNAKGYILTGSLGVARDTFLSLRYFSSQVISGPPDGNNVLQLDLQSSF